MKYQILLSGKSKKNIINLSSTEVAQRVVKVTVLISNNMNFHIKVIYRIYFKLWDILTPYHTCP